MSPLIMFPFGVFFCCAILQFPLLRRIRAALADRHPEVWREISMKAWFANSVGSQMVWGGRAKALGDPDLMEAVNRLRLVYAVGVAAWLALVALLLTSPIVARH
jgi:polyferredoxin